MIGNRVAADCAGAAIRCNGEGTRQRTIIAKVFDRGSEITNVGTAGRVYLCEDIVGDVRWCDTIV